MARQVSSRSRSEKESISIGWKQKWLTINGTMPILVVLIVGILWFVSQLILRMIDSPIEAIHATSVEISREHKLLSEQHDAILKTQQRIADTLEIQTYLMTKSDAERRSFDLEKPEALKRK
jgi:hypothetical protein